MRLHCHVGSERIYFPRYCAAGFAFWAGTLLCFALCQPACDGAGIRGEPLGGAGSAQTSETQEMQVSMGLCGVWKLGQVTPIRVRLPADWGSRPTSLEVTTVDGEGVTVTYRQSITTKQLGESRDVWCSVTIGRADQPLTVRVRDQNDQPIAVREIAERELGTVLPPTQAWIVAVGSSLGVEATSFTLANTGLPNFSTTVVTSSDQIPDHWQGLSGCDVLILSTTKPPVELTSGTPVSVDNQTGDSNGEGSTPVVEGLTRSQWQAIEDWIGHGGLAVISLGDYAVRLPADAAFRKLLPGEVVDSLPNISTASLEASTATNIQLAPISATRLKDVRGQVELSMLDNSGKRFPWWVRYSHGKGVLHFIGSDLDQTVLREWKDRRVVWDKVLAAFWSREERNDAPTADRNVSGTTYLGYDDLVGQLRATLDYFPTARIFSFGAVALILALLLIVIGPIDYWISVRWLRRPQFSWYLSGLVLAATSISLIWLERISRPTQLLLNSAHIVDFLPEQNRALVDSWTHVYSSRAQQIDVGMQLASTASDVRLDWQGLPGKGLGGMESNLLADQGMPGYAVQLVSDADRSSATTPNALVSGVGIPTSGTKCLVSTWSQEFTPTGKSELSELSGIDQIQGLLVNPLPYDILRPVLMYHHWAYSLPSRLRAGEELSITYEMVPKDLMRRLNRRQIINSNDVITPWLPDDRQSLDRLLEIMMFYKASGGADYVKLKHRFQPRIDGSNALALDHAVLFGELAEPLGTMEVLNIPSNEIKQESSSTWCRVLLPVARAEE